MNHLSVKHTIRILACVFYFLSSAILAQTQLGSDLTGDHNDSRFGGAVALTFDGSRLAVGASNSDTNGMNAGLVRVFQWSNGAWNQVGADLTGKATEERFGASVAISSNGNRLAVGAPGIDFDSGRVRVFEWIGDTWVQLGEEIPGEDAADAFGRSVSLSSSGHRLAVGAHFADGPAMQAGHVRVFEWSGSAWEQLGSDIDGEAFEDSFGASVSLSSEGDRLAIGAPQSSWNNVPGYVKTYQWSGEDWVPLGDTLLGDVAGESFGLSVSMSQDASRLAVGAPWHVAGQVKVYELIDNAWSQIGVDIDGEFDGDRSGRPVSISSEGTRLAIGAFGNEEFGTLSGQVRIYQWTESSWQQIGSDLNGNAENDFFGRSVSISGNGDRLAVGSTGPGIVRVYSLSQFNPFEINAGLNDAWFNRATPGQGFLLTVFPDRKEMFLAWFTFDTQRPPEDAVALLGEPGHRWLTAQGPYDGDTAELTIFVTEGGEFDAIEPKATTDLEGDGTLTIQFADCNAGLVSYEITSLGISGEIPIERIVLDNVPLCESLIANTQ